MWKVEFESLKAEDNLRSLIENGALTKEDREIISLWIRQVELHGPESIQGKGMWNDHALNREWRGYRSSSFSNKGRIIYCIREKV